MTAVTGPKPVTRRTRARHGALPRIDIGKIVCASVASKVNL